MTKKTKRGNRSPGEVDATLIVRDGTHGDYSQVAALYCGMEGVINRFVVNNGRLLPAEVRMSLDMILVKIARIVAGDPFFHDHWHDIEGYARLISRGIE